MQMPISPAHRNAASVRKVSTANANMVRAEMAVMPDAKPSRPSIRLMTFMKATR